MLGPSYAVIELARILCKVQSVALMRLARLARGGSDAHREARRMIEEKFEALAEAEVEMVDSLARGEFPMVAVVHANAPVRRCVNANSNRLTH